MLSIFISTYTDDATSPVDFPAPLSEHTMKVNKPLELVHLCVPLELADSKFSSKIRLSPTTGRVCALLLHALFGVVVHLCLQTA